MVSLSGCTRLTPVLPQPFLTPKEQTSDLGWQNLISASRVCLSYILILATWARPRDCLTPNSGGRGGWGGRQTLLFDYHSTQEPPWSSRTGQNQRFFSFFIPFATSPGGAGSGPARAGGLWEKFCMQMPRTEASKTDHSVLHIPFLT